MATARTRFRTVTLDEEQGGIIPEPEPTEEDLRLYEEMKVRMEEDRRRAIEAGERLPPITDEIWKTKD